MGRCLLQDPFEVTDSNRETGDRKAAGARSTSGRMRVWLPVVLSFLLVCGIGWIGIDRLEQQNDFCNACHLPDTTPLHLEIRERFDRVIPQNLAGVHGRGWVEDRENTAFRCIDCHAGSGLLERGKIKMLSARDGFRYLIGSFEEPDEMAFELSAQACRRCHSSFRHSAAPGWTLTAYHGRPAHDEPEALRCVRCHPVHETNGDAFAYFMNRSRVDRQCQECHVPGSEKAVPPLAPCSSSESCSS